MMRGWISCENEQEGLKLGCLKWKKLIETNRKYYPVQAKHNLDVKLGNVCLILN